MAEIAENMHEGLLALAVGAGLQVMEALMDADVTTLAGPKGKHDIDADRGAPRPRARLGEPGRAAGAGRPARGCAPLTGRVNCRSPSYELFSSTEILGKMAMEKMLAGLSTRRYPVGLEPVGEQVEEKASATSKSAVSRRFVAMTETALAELLAAGSVRAGSGRVDDRRRALRRVVLRRGARASASTGSSTRWRWWRARPRTPRW